MPVLKNAKYERFAQEVAKGKNAEEAYKIAGYKPHRQNAHRLITNDDIMSRVAEIQGRAAAKAEITAQMVIEELAKIGFSNMLDYIRPSEEGDAYVDLSNLTREQAAAISEVTVEDFKDARETTTTDDGEEKKGREVRKIKFKLHDKRAALVDIGKHLGMFVERAEIKLNDISNEPEPTPDEWADKHGKN